jgi:hypothetical protein
MKYSMMKMMKRMIWIALPVLLAACAFAPIEMPEEGDGITDATEQGGQLPLEVVQQASNEHGGSMVTASAQPAAAGGAGVPGSSMAVGKGVTLVLGPIDAERLQDSQGGSGDAGKSIREIISQRLIASGGITLLDAPEERFINDSPRPDLARKGIQYVVKGIASFNAGSSEVTVFLRAVETMSGKVAMVASARNQSRDAAAFAASDRLLNKMVGTEQ